MNPRLPVLGLWLLLAAVAWAAPDFEREVAPILEARCLSCHNAVEAKGDLVLETREDLLDHEDSLVPGDAEASGLIDVVSGPEPEMPKTGRPLSKDEVATLQAWIVAGAEWPAERLLVDNPERDLDWWSLKPLAAADVPGSAGEHPVDAFIEATLTEKGLEAVEAADALTLIRRLHYDLTGLPPTPEEVAAFRAAYATDPDGSVARVVDELLNQPEFGEKWGQHWLDLARYAETHGYDKDKLRLNAWPYRDYVIRSLNADKPLTQFVREQVAGDVLYPGEADGVLGLGFLAAGPWDFIGHKEVGEGKLDGRIAKHLDRDEMVSAVFNVFQSTTVQCAQCHHHKFDPVRMEDYYRLHAVFAAVDRAERTYDGLSPEQEREKQEITGRIAALQQQKRSLEEGINKDPGLQDVRARIAGLKAAFPPQQQAPQYGYHSQISPKQEAEKWVQVDLGHAHHLTQVRIHPAYDTYAGIGAGFGFPLRWKLEAAADPDFREGVRTLHDATSQDQPNPGTAPIDVEVGGEPVRYLRFTATKLAERKGDYILALGELQAVDEMIGENHARAALVTAKDSIESGERWGRANLVDGIYYQELADAKAMTELRALQADQTRMEAKLRTPQFEAELAKLESDLGALEKQLRAMPKGQMVYAAATSFARNGNFKPTDGKPRPIHLLNRGDLSSPGDAMLPGAPPLWEGASSEFREALRVEGEGWNEGKARAELALYLTQEDNPLLWRSLANRVWQWTFGQPLVGTPNDFGRMGLQPTHPELLDYLAARLRDDPEQSIKGLVRHLMTSETYRRASTSHEANLAIDGDNQYLWRAHRRRLTAEEFRDSLLVISGVMRLEDRGGPSFQDFVIEKPQHSPHYQYHLFDPENPTAFRRSIYRFVVRSQPQPLLTTLDCADPSISVPERDESTTALQALTQWNNRLIEAMSRQFAQRLQQEAPDSAEARLELACQLVFGRAPSDAERPILRAHQSEYGDASLARLLFNTNAFTYLD